MHVRSPSSRSRLVWPGMVVLAAALMLVLLPRMMEPGNARTSEQLHGRELDGSIVYHDMPLAAVLADVERLTGFHAVAFPAVGERRFSGSLSIDAEGSDRQRGEAEGKAAAEQVAASMGLRLRKAGPHWVVAENAGAQP